MARIALLSLIVAVARNGVIGRNGALPWRLPDDLRRFKQLTLGKPVLMGRRTHESIGRALPERTNVVVSRDAAYRPAASCAKAASLDDALRLVATAPEAFVIGGASLYAETAPRAARLFVTEVLADFEGDVRCPDLGLASCGEVAREHHPADARHECAFDFVVYERR